MGRHRPSRAHRERPDPPAPPPAKPWWVICCASVGRALEAAYLMRAIGREDPARGTLAALGLANQEGGVTPDSSAQLAITVCELALESVQN